MPAVVASNSCKVAPHLLQKDSGDFIRLLTKSEMCNQVMQSYYSQCMKGRISSLASYPGRRKGMLETLLQEKGIL